MANIGWFLLDKNFIKFYSREVIKGVSPDEKLMCTIMNTIYRICLSFLEKYSSEKNACFFQFPFPPTKEFKKQIEKVETEIEKVEIEKLEQRGRDGEK